MPRAGMGDSIQVIFYCAEPLNIFSFDDKVQGLQNMPRPKNCLASLLSPSE